MNGFERHNIDHLSASSLNLWRNAPDVWVTRYLLDKRTPFGPAPERGKAVENAVVSVLRGDDMGSAVKRAVEGFNNVFTFDAIDKLDAIEKERNLIAPMTEIAVAELEEYGEPSFDADNQHKISVTAKGDGWEIPVIGFLDLLYPEHGLVVDLKTTQRVPSAMSLEHQVQRAIYAKAKGNHAVKFLYVSDKKAAWLEDGDPDAVLARLKIEITRLECFLRLHSAQDAVLTVPVNAGSFYWRGAETLLSEIYGL